MSDETPELLPCPFCGGDATVEEVENAIGLVGSVCFSVGCNNPNEDSCMGYQSFQTFALRRDAIKAWNTRPTPAERSTKSAPDFKATHNSGESDPTVTQDCSGADTERLSGVPSLPDVLLDNLERARTRLTEPVPQEREALEKCRPLVESFRYQGKKYSELLDEIDRALTARPSDAAVAWNFGRVLDLAQEGLARWKDKPHNARWWRKIDGTPIPNDLLVNIAEVIAESLRALPPDEPARVIDKGK